MLRLSPALRLIGAALLVACAPMVHAQYSWIGENGVRQFSDRPPPPGTPPHKILKAPGRAAQPPVLVQAQAQIQAQAPAEGSGSAAPGTPPAAAARKGPPTLAEQEAAYRERVRQRAEQERKEAEDAQRRSAIAERCDLARSIKAQAESGIRVTRTDARGERSFLTDEERAADAARANKVLAECR